MTTIQYPSSGPNYSYAYDTMGRLNTMTNVGTSTQMITGTTYDPANRLLSISGNVLSETRSYNTMGQLTNITSTAYGYPGGNVNITYNYSSTQIRRAESPGQRSCNQRFLGAELQLRWIRQPDRSNRDSRYGPDAECRV